MAIFKEQLTIPEKGDPFYNTKANGGYSRAIQGKPTQPNLDVLNNCVGYCVGRFHAICNDVSMHYLQPVNAEEFIDYADSSLKVGFSPKLGACAVWQKGEKGGADGAGHVAIVERIYPDGSILTSESGWNASTPFWTTVRRNDGNWGQPSNYTFLGFIYQPIDYEPETKPSEITFTVQNVHKGCVGAYVIPVQVILKGFGFYKGELDGSAGELTRQAILQYEAARGLNEDGDFGPKCWRSFLLMR